MTTPSTLFEQLQTYSTGQQRPPLHLWHPKRSGTIDISIDFQGQWTHEGGVITRESLVRLFATILRKEGTNYYLVTPAEKLLISVADAPFLMVDMDTRGAGTAADLIFRSNVGDLVMADAEHAIEMRGERPYLHIRDGLYGRITRSVFYRLVEMGVDEAGTLAVYSQNTRFALGELGDSP